MFSKVKARIVTLFIVLILNCPVLPAQAAVWRSTSHQITAGQLRERGMVYYNSNDTTDAAAKQFQHLIARFPATDEAEEAQYYLASYYHRKYYINKEKWRDMYPEPLSRAEMEYKKYIEKYSKRGTRRWLSDALFNLSLVYLQLGNVALAIEPINKIADWEAEKDPQVFVYQIVWSANSQDVINQDLDAMQLAEFARSQIIALRESGFDNLVLRLKRWCQSQKTGFSSAKN